MYLLYYYSLSYIYYSAFSAKTKKSTKNDIASQQHSTNQRGQGDEINIRSRQSSRSTRVNINTGRFGEVSGNTRQTLARSTQLTAPNLRTSKPSVHLPEQGVYVYPFAFETLKHIPRRSILLHPFTTLLRSLFLTAVIVLIGDYPLPQLLVALSAEVAYIIYLTRVLPKKSVVEAILDFISQLMCILYIVGKLFSLLSMSEDTRQAKIGKPLGWLLAIYAIVILLSVILLVIINILILVKRQCCKKKRKKQEQPVA